MNENKAAFITRWASLYFWRQIFKEGNRISRLSVSRMSELCSSTKSVLTGRHGISHNFGTYTHTGSTVTGTDGSLRTLSYQILIIKKGGSALHDSHPRTCAQLGFNIHPLFASPSLALFIVICTTLLFQNKIHSRSEIQEPAARFAITMRYCHQGIMQACH